MERGYEKKEVGMNKYVLTGGPCSGKTSLINCLRERGFNVLEEVAREVIEEMNGMDYDKSQEQEIRQEMIFERQLEREAKLKGDVFLDRGLLDNLAYSQHLIGYVPENTKIDFSNRYDKVFALDMLPFVDDGLRIESGDEEAEKIHELIVNVYEKFDYNVVNVPVFGGQRLGERVGNRVDYILDCLKGGVE